MSFQTTCPECDKVHRLADAMLGKTIRCKNCETPFKARPEETDDDEEESRSSRRRETDRESRPRSSEKRTSDSNAEIRKRSRRDEDDEDDDVDRPRRKPLKRRQKKSSGNGLVIGLVAGGLALVAVVVVLVVVLGGKKPSDKDRGGDSSSSASKETESANPNVLSRYAQRLPIDSSGWVLNDRNLMAPGFAAVIYQKQQAEVTKASAIYDVNSGKQLGSFDLGDTKVLQQAALSPKGAYLATMEMRPSNKGTFDREVTLWSLPGGQAKATRWMPYPPVSTADPRYRELTIAWIGFIDSDKLLTVTEGGRVSLWSMPNRTAIYDKRPLIAELRNRLSLDIYTWEPKNLALSADRRTLALQQGEGVLLVDTATGEPAGALPAIDGIGQLPEMLGMAFSPDGASLGCFIQGVVVEKKGLKGVVVEKKDISVHSWVAVWDVPKKKLKFKSRLPESLGMNAMLWWGGNHIYGLMGTGINGLLINAETGKPVRQCLGPFGGRIANGHGDGQVWTGIFAPGRDGMDLVSYAPPDKFIAKDPDPNDGGSYKCIWLTKDGVENQGNNIPGKVPIVP